MQLKRYLAWMLAALFALLPAAGLAAENRDTQITTTLPEEHTITVVCGAGGAVRVNGTVYTGETMFSVKRLSAFELEVVADTGYYLNNVVLHPDGGMSITGSNTVTIDSVYEDKSLTLVFMQSTPGTTVEPTPTPTATTAAPGSNVLYEEYLGTGKGLRELEIVFDGDYQRMDYDFLPVFYGEQQQGDNLLLVRAHPDQNGEIQRRSLLLTGTQLARLWQDKGLQYLQFCNGEASARLRIEELLTADMAKRIDLLSRGEGMNPEDLAALLPEVELTADQLRNLRLEVRITPEEPDEEALRRGYQVEIYLWYGDAQVEISQWIPSLEICMAAEELQRDQEREEFVAAFAVTATDEDGSTTWLDSELRMFPVDRTDDLPDEAECFEGSVPLDDGAMVIAYDPNVPVAPYRCYALCADWAGNAVYRLEERLTPAQP